MTSPFERPAPGRLPPLPRSIRRFVIWLAAALFVALIVIPWLASFFTDWLWFSEVGFQTVFVRSLLWRIGLFVIGGAFACRYFSNRSTPLARNPSDVRVHANDVRSGCNPGGTACAVLVNRSSPW